MSEANIMRRLQVYITKLGARVLRNNVGMAWTGTPQHIRVPTTIILYAGDLILRESVPIKFGLGVGSSDLIGWQPFTITQAMVGKKFARFTAVEVKTETGRVTPEQQDFISAVNDAGGIAGVIRSEEDAKQLLTPGL